MKRKKQPKHPSVATFEHFFHTTNLEMESPNTDFYNSFVSVFLKAANLERFVIYACNASKLDNTDPISNIIVAIVSSPISISFSNVGIRAFKSTSIAALQYYLLDQKQCNFIKNLITAILDGSLNTGITSDANGGFILRIFPPKTNIFVEKNEVLQALSRAVRNVSGYGDAIVKERVFSILSQRISAMVTMSSGKGA